MPTRHRRGARQRSALLTLLGAGLTLVSVACTGGEPAALPPPDPSAEELPISAGTQGDVAGLSLGIASVGDGTASVVIRQRDGMEVVLDGPVGSGVTYQGHLVQIAEVGERSARVRVTPPEDDAPPSPTGEAVTASLVLEAAQEVAGLPLTLTSRGIDRLNIDLSQSDGSVVHIHGPAGEPVTLNGARFEILDPGERDDDPVEVRITPPGGS